MHLKNLYIKTFGCQMNEYDSSRLSDLLKYSHGLELVDSPEQADVLILNTCSIREKAEDKFYSELGRWHKLKLARNNNMIIGVGGCVASQEGEAIRAKAHYVDIIFGPQTIHKVPGLLTNALNNKKVAIDTRFLEIEKFDKLPDPGAKGPCAFVSIMEGCSKYCSYCIVPYTRGEEVSRPLDDILYECFVLQSKGVKEITLLGQNVNAYQGKKADGAIVDLADLLHYVAAIDGIERIRFTTSHPVHFSERLIDAYSTIPKLANHLHLPVQSGSDRILAKMKRGHTIAEYIEKIQNLRLKRPDIAITSDFIVGFPGETEDDFLKTIELVNKINYDNSFSFIYSPRPGTPAAFYQDDITLETKKARLEQLQKLLSQQYQKNSSLLLGNKVSAMVTGKATKTPELLSGRTDNNRVINFKAPADLIGQMVDLMVTNIFTNSLFGEVITR